MAGKAIVTAATFPAGRYYVGDPCYVFREGWVALLDENNHLFNNLANWNGHDLWAASTSYGDGTYVGSDGHEYSVDAGIIGIVPVEVMEVTEDEVVRDALGTIVDFKEPVAVHEINGVFVFGHLTIDTNSSPEEEEEEEEDSCSDEDEEE